MVLLSVEPDGDADPFYTHTVWKNARPVGIVTSGAPGHRTGTVLALAYLRPETGEAADAELRGDDGTLEVSVLGRRCAARVLDAPPWDPTDSRLRGALRKRKPARSGKDRRVTVSHGRKAT